VSLAREGLALIAVAVLVAAGAFALALSKRSWGLWIAAYILAVIALWVAYFFRDPQRTGPRGERLVIAPADGRVVMISEVDEPDFVRGRSTRISIFMNIFNVHVNRYPVSGTVRYLHRNPGKFLNAASDKASLLNEQTSVGIEGSRAPVAVRQIAGLIARRIVNYSAVGATVRQGDRMGIIRFGSRVDVFVPPTATLRVQLGDKPLAGVTVLAELSE